MLLGRARRKTISQAFAFGVFRWVTLWVIIATCSAKGEAGQAVALAVIATDIIANSVFRGLTFAQSEQSREDWANILTDRIFYKLLFNAIRDQGAQSIDIDELFQIATKEAVADVKSAEERQFTLDSTAWHWFGGALAFAGYLLSFGLYYGSALFVGTGGFG